MPDLPIARWPRLDGTYPDGPGPEVHTQSQLAQLVALGRTLLVIPASSRAWQWPEHVAVPVVHAPRITSVLRERAIASRGKDWIIEGHDWIARWVADPLAAEVAAAPSSPTG